MIGLLRGQVAHKQPPMLILDVQGVGYELQAPMSTFYQLPTEEVPVTLYTHLAVREDAQILYGFANLAERTLFRTLLKVNGVGGKMALAILSGMSHTEFTQAIQTGNVAALTGLPGVGKKTAERLILDMKDRLPGTTVPAQPGSTTQSATTAPATNGARDDALGALLALGYKPAEAQRMLKTITDDTLPVEDMIRQALQTTRT
ncbi:MAG: Holliday junction branch migration protein RuvA [Pseudomonadota bacterium]